MNSQTILSNLRWLCLPSENQGKDWIEKSADLDINLEKYGLDLEEAGVYLIFSESPRSILENNGHCLVARSVTGPWKEPEPPLVIIDFVSRPVWRKTLSGNGLYDLLSEADSFRTELLMQGKSARETFILLVRRELKPDLKVNVEVIFQE